MTAIKAVFPDAEIKRCAFHWGQAVMRKVANLGLKTSYNENKGVHIFVRKLLALPYLPADHIRPAFKQHQTNHIHSTTAADQLSDQHLAQQHNMECPAVVCVPSDRQDQQ